MPPRYQPDEYWSERLSAELNLRGTGHLSYSEGYNDWLYRAKRRALHRALVGVDAPARALDVGSGVGWVVDQLRGRGFEVDGCDITDVAVEHLRARFPASTFSRVSIGRDPIPAPDATYGLVTMLDVAYHVTDDGEWRRALAEVARVLRPGGSFVVTDGFDLDDRRPADHVHHRSLGAWTDATAAVGLMPAGRWPLYRWLSRDPGGPLDHLPDRARGAVEFALERVVPRSPHLRIARFARLTPVTSG